MKKRNDPGRALLRISLKKGRAEPEGEISGMQLPESVRFFGYADMVRKIERIYDLLEYQVSAEEVGNPENDEKDAEEDRWAGTILSNADNLGKVLKPMEPLFPGNPVVYLTTLYRRNHNLQGYFRMSGAKENRRIPFRNVPELIRLLERYREEHSGKQAV